ncbi:MAG: methyltransferase domain-containing protein [Candidatus Omnitrophica bacterium]|nr:methyltransferase domain-containing protein [Candidatus Omnitrophota bacterium]
MLKELYRHRFSEQDQREKKGIWQTLCRDFFQKYVKESDAVLEIGAGYCEFINNIKCREKYALDLDEDVRAYANPDVKAFVSSSSSLSFLSESSMDIVFMSNFLEHLKDKEEVLKTLTESFRVLKPQGVLMVLGPNIRYLSREYWDFFDHYIPLSDKSLAEALQISGFKVEQNLPKFLPYTTKSRFPKNPLLVKLYLHMPFIWPVLGRQMFILGRKP